MLDIVLRDAITYSSLLILMSTGLTLTYITTKVPNFAFGAFATIGGYVVLTGAKLFGINPYGCLPLASIAGAIAALSLYLFILKPLTKRGGSFVLLTASTVGFEMIVLALINIYADYLSRVHKIFSRDFLLRSLDFKFMDLPGIFIVSSAAMLVLVFVLHLFLTRTKFGVAMRAAIENPSLAGVVGIDVNKVYTTSWIIAGLLAGLAGGLLSMYVIGTPLMGSNLLPSIFAASVVGGLSNIYGAMLGGALMGLSEIYGITMVSYQFGGEIIAYRPIIPLVVMAVTLLVAPTGLTGINWAAVKRILRGKKD
jgi:branched-chain amino acid transport system permease protein